MARLGINVDHVATVRQARGGTEPDPVIAATLCERAGADFIVMHLREDRRHIQDRDVRLVGELLQTHLDLEMAATDEMVAIAEEIQPQVAMLVPEKRQELTTEGGLDVLSQQESLSKQIQRIHNAGIKVSLFIDPIPEQIKASRDAGADIVELHTGTYANARGEAQQQELQALTAGALLASGLGLTVTAGHGLNYHNVQSVNAIPQISGFSIGHAIVSRAVMVGMERAVREMAALVHTPPGIPA